MQLAAAVLASLLAGSVVLPKDASIVATSSGSNDSSGNVRVEFTDGHAEMWTKNGGCKLPLVSETGLVGWIKGADGPVPIIRVCWPDGHFKDYGNAESYPNLEGWCFTENNTAIALKPGWKHGPAHYTEYALLTGKLISHAKEGDRDFPAWAEYLDKFMERFA